MSLKPKTSTNDDSISSRVLTNSQMYDLRVTQPAKKLHEIANDTSGKYKPQMFFTPPNMRWRKNMNGDKKVWELEEMPRKERKMTGRKLRKIRKNNVVDDACSESSDSSDTDSNDSAV